MRNAWSECVHGGEWKGPEWIQRGKLQPPKKMNVRTIERIRPLKEPNQRTSTARCPSRCREFRLGERSFRGD